MELFALGEGDFDLDFATLEVHFGDDDREALFAGLATELVDFAAVEEEFSLPHRHVVGQVAMGIFRDMGVDDPTFVIANFGEGVLELNFSATGGFDFRA